MTPARLEEQPVVEMNETHSPELRSWVETANEPGTDFPMQNLPLGRFRRTGSGGPFEIGVAIGDQILGLKRAGVVDHADMNMLMAAPLAERHALRLRLSRGLRRNSPERA